jgi:hypothetical protein
MFDFIWNIPTIIDVVSKIRNYFDWGIEKFRKKQKGRLHEFDFSIQEDSAHIWKGILDKDFYRSPNYWKDWKIKDTIAKISADDVVCIKNAVLSRWIPVMPGQIFSNAVKPLDKENENLIRYVEKEGGELEAKMIFDTEYIFKTGIASIRVLPRSNKFLLCSSNEATFTGLPLLVDGKVYKSKIKEGEKTGCCVLADIECVLEEIPAEWNKDLLRCIPKNLLKRYTLPRYLLELKSINNIKDAPTSIAAAWCGFKADFNAGFCETFKTSRFIINKGETAIKEAAEKIISYADFLRSGLIGGSWSTLFDFDETRKWIPESSFNPLEHSSDKIDQIINTYYKNF